MHKAARLISTLHIAWSAATWESSPINVHIAIKVLMLSYESIWLQAFLLSILSYTVCVCVCFIDETTLSMVLNVLKVCMLGEISKFQLVISFLAYQCCKGPSVV